MPLRFDQNTLRARIARLSPKARAEFALACAERLLPQYRRYREQTGQGAPDLLADALAAARDRLTKEDAGVDLEPLAERCETLVPVEDDPAWTSLSGLAQNAASAAVYAIRGVASGSIDDAMWAGVQGYEAADLIATNQLDVDFNEPGIEDRIMAEDVVQKELVAQDELLSRLERR